MSNGPSVGSGLPTDAQQALAWLERNYLGGRAPVFSVQEIARGLFGRTEGPAPGISFDPSTWGRVRQAIIDLEQAGLVEQGRLPQGDFGYRLRRPS